MQEQIQQNEAVKISRAAMETELGNSYKRCWAFAFQQASEELDYDLQIDNLCREFDLIKSQAEWFVKGANSILFKSEKPKQQELTNFSKSKANTPNPSETYVSQLEMMSFLEDIKQMSHNTEFSEFWSDLNELKQSVIEQQCATEKEVLRIFQIRSIVEHSQQEKERFFDAYPVSTDAWENGHFDIAGEIIY